MDKLIELLEKIFKKDNPEEIILDSRMEIRLNSKEKILVDKYCKLRNTDKSKLVRKLLMQEIDSFIRNTNNYM
ncbi:MAG: DUF6290 family protein [Peptostreptococcaceae bacterium]